MDSASVGRRFRIENYLVLLGIQQEQEQEQEQQQQQKLGSL